LRDLSFNAGLDKVKAFRPKGLILSGGPSSVYDSGAPLIDKAHLELGIPVLGICYGMQLLTHVRAASSPSQQNGNTAGQILKLTMLPVFSMALAPHSALRTPHLKQSSG